LDSGGPFATAPDPFATVPDPFGGLTEQATSNAFGSQDPFSSQDPFGGAASFPSAPVNPYASPQPSASYAKKTATSRQTGNRRGLPWDRKDTHDEPFLGTIKLVLFSPSEAFSAMRHSGGDAHPVLFCIYGNLIGGAFAMLYRVIVDLIFTLPDIMQGGGGQAAVMFFVSLAVGLVIALVSIVAGSVVGSYVNAGMMHLCLMMLGGANQSFETTARVVQYTWGATALAGVIPCVGPLVQAIANLVILCLGLANAHQTSGVKATFAVLIPLILCVGAVIGLAVVLIASLASWAPQ